MFQYIRKNLALVLAFALPIALIAVVALNSYLPSFFLSTDYNFLYSSCTDGAGYHYYCDNYLQKRYSVVNGKVTVNPIDPAQDSDSDGITDINENFTTRLFLHDTEKNESREITFEEAQAFFVNELLTSPDGVSVSSSYDRGSGFFFLFDSGSSSGYYLTKGKNRSKLNLINSDDRYYYPDNFRFIGWVLPGRN